MNPKIKDAILAGFMADALSLGVHWVYDTSDIDKKYGRLEHMVKPELAPYHRSKLKGEFTHYGDQMMVLLESVADKSGFDLNDFGRAWKKLFGAYNGYVDQATKDTLANFSSKKKSLESGSMSLDLGGAARIAPLALYHGEDVDAFIAAAASQTAMTHNSAQVIQCAELFARASSLVLKGTQPTKAFQKAIEAMPKALEIKGMVKAGLDSRSQDTRQAIAGFGQMCSVGAALPSTLHLIAKYEDNLKEALIENIMAGGDSSARGILTGFILGCHQGSDTIPDQWRTDMIACEKIIRLMN